MSAQEEIGIKIKGDASGAKDAMSDAADAVEGGSRKMNESMGSMGSLFDMVKEKFFMMAAALGGVAFVQSAVEQTSALYSEAGKLATMLGGTVAEVGSLKMAVESLGSDMDAYTDVFKEFAGKLSEDEKAMTDMGLATRDTTGSIRPANELFLDAIKLVQDYKPGLEQTAAAMKLFGEEVDASHPLLKLSAEAIEEARLRSEELGLTLTNEGVQAVSDYKKAQNQLQRVMGGIQKVVGEAVMPAFTEVGQYLASTGPYVINVFKGAVTGLMLVFRALQVALRTVAGSIFEFINATIDQLGNLSELVSAVLSGDFDRAATTAVAMKDRVVQAFRNIKSEAKDAFATGQESFQGDAARIWSPTAASKPTAAGGTKTIIEPKEEKEKKPKEEQHLALVEAELAATKLKYAAENDLREMNKEEELNAYIEILGKYTLTENEKVASTKKTSEMRLGVLRAARQEEVQLSNDAIEAYKAQQLATHEPTRQAMRARVDLGLASQAELLALEQQLEDDKYRIQKQAIDAKLALLERDPTASPQARARLNNEMVALEQEHAQRTQGLMQEQQATQLRDWQTMFSAVGSTFGQTVAGLLTHTMTLGQAVRGLLGSVLGAVSNFIGQIIAKKVAAWATEKALGMAEIGMNAAKAGSGAAASQASIPIAGPGLALAAMAAVFAAVLGMGRSVPSARNGFDIPSGVNPLTQLHEREMVLPQEQADAVRSMSGGGGGTVVLNTQGGDWVHKDDLVTLMRKMNRQFKLVS